jgi:uncharacterized protein (DUF1800 family)
MEHQRGALALLLCVALCAPQVPAQTPPSPQPSTHPSAAGTSAKPRPAYRSGQLQGDQRILHALNRFTFGPRPGDLEAVKSMGLDRWFEQQLNPATVDNSDLTVRLEQFPAMQWSTEDLLYRLPSDAMIRQAADGKIPIPPSGALHAVYVNQLDRYALKKQAKEEKKQQTPSAQTGADGAVAPDMAEKPAMQTNPSVETQAGQAGAQQMNTMAAEEKPERPAVDEAQLARILAQPPQRRVAQLASMKPEDFEAFRKGLKPPQRHALVAGMSPELRETVAALENPKNLINSELCEQRLTRDIYSNAQLQEVMTDFWLNHFNVFLHKNDETPYYLVSYERDFIRPRALGKFEDLLEAVAHSPAMLLYLDNSSSMGPDSIAAERAARNGKNKAHEGLNENYARELMELHTLGVNGGYTQKDVTQVARVFTGWTVDRPQRGGGFLFDENRHEPGTKLVLGKKIKDHGEREGREVLHMLATSPATAHFISRKLAIRFVSDEPPQALVDRMAAAYLKCGGDIPTVLRMLFNSPEFWAADDYRAKVKTPLEYVVSSLRASNAQIGVQPDDLKPIVNALQGMGMPIYGAIPPTGYNWQSSTWVSAGALVNRMNFALLLTGNKFGGMPASWAEPANVTVEPATALSGAPAAAIPTPEAEEQRLESLLVAGGVSDSTRAAVLQQLQVQGAPDSPQGMPVAAEARPIYPARAAKDLEKQDQLLAGLLLGSPEFQRR